MAQEWVTLLISLSSALAGIVGTYIALTMLPGNKKKLAVDTDRTTIEAAIALIQEFRQERVIYQAERQAYQAEREAMTRDLRDVRRELADLYIAQREVERQQATRGTTIEMLQKQLDEVRAAMKKLEKENAELRQLVSDLRAELLGAQQKEKGETS